MSNYSHYYEILGLSSEATAKEIKKAYRKLVKKWHPDHFNDDEKLEQEAQDKIKKIIEAYEKITNPENNNYSFSYQGKPIYDDIDDYTVKFDSIKLTKLNRILSSLLIILMFIYFCGLSLGFLIGIFAGFDFIRDYSMSLTTYTIFILSFMTLFGFSYGTLIAIVQSLDVFDFIVLFHKYVLISFCIALVFIFAGLLIILINTTSFYIVITILLLNHLELIGNLILN